MFMLVCLHFSFYFEFFHIVLTRNTSVCSVACSAEHWGATCFICPQTRSTVMW